MHTAYFDRFTIYLLLNDAESGSHQGDCSDDIAALRRVPYITEQLNAIYENDLRTELARWGAWSDDDLADHDENLSRILWIACGNIQDDAENDAQSDAQ